MVTNDIYLPGPMFGILIWWVVSARKWFKGPKVNIEHRAFHETIEGVEGKADGGSDSGSQEHSKGKEY